MSLVVGEVGETMNAALKEPGVQRGRSTRQVVSLGDLSHFPILYSSSNIQGVAREWEREKGPRNWRRQESGCHPRALTYRSTLPYYRPMIVSLGNGGSDTINMNKQNWVTTTRHYSSDRYWWILQLWQPPRKRFWFAVNWGTENVQSSLCPRTSLKSERAIKNCYSFLSEARSSLYFISLCTMSSHLVSYQSLGWTDHSCLHDFL